MKPVRLESDPFNIIITGVGGQGNVTASRLMGGMLAGRGLFITIGETFGASQRGGSVMSHLRVSQRSSWSPQIPRGRCDLLIALEPTEALRVLSQYGNPGTRVLCNTRPVHAIGVISGEQAYPRLDELSGWIRELSGAAFFLNATEGALELGNPILGNIIMIGGAAAVGVLPLSRADFEAALERSLPAEKRAVNLRAFDLGYSMVEDSGPGVSPS
jgi:indolepyruvate ferredoxin oxidoreductase beta subunit